jgi:YegS/Rv2252/BmrU family lipid kinase
MTTAVARSRPPESRLCPRIAVIFNPVAGSPRRRQALARALRALRAGGCRVKLRATNAAGDAARSAMRIAVAGTFDAILVAGGDGTISDAAHGLATAPVENLPALACLPLGTANVLAHEIGLPIDPVTAARVAAALRTIEMPLARIGNRHFLLMAGAGFDAHVVAHVAPAFKKRWGKLAYVAEMARGLGRYPFRRYRVTVDGKTHDTASVVVSRGRHYGGRFVLAPDANLAEAALHVCLFGQGGRFGVLLYATALGLGLLKRTPGFRIVRGRQVRIDGTDGEPVQADGDLIATLPVEIELTGRAIRLVVP